MDDLVHCATYTASVIFATHPGADSEGGQRGHVHCPAGAKCPRYWTKCWSDRSMCTKNVSSYLVGPPSIFWISPWQIPSMVIGQYPTCYAEYLENTENPEYLYGKQGKLWRTHNTCAKNAANYGKPGKLRTTQNTCTENYRKPGKLQKMKNFVLLTGQGVFRSFPCFP